MNRRLKIFIVLGSVALGILVALGIYTWGDQERAKFVLSVLSSLTVLTAIVGALYGDRFKMWADPIEISLEKIESKNACLDQHANHGKVYCHHIRVRNNAPHRTVTNCRVWLEHVADETTPGKFETTERFAVPRLMQWAPAEFTPEVRSFSDEQVLDLGFTRCSDGAFLPTWNDKQRGYVTPDLLCCPPGKKRRYYLRVAADNYLPRGHLIVEVFASAATTAQNIQTGISFSAAK